MRFHITVLCSGLTQLDNAMTPINVCFIEYYVTHRMSHLNTCLRKYLVVVEFMDYTYADMPQIFPGILLLEIIISTNNITKYNS